MKDTNVPVEEKCEACKAWESETGYGKLCNHFDMKSVPVEKWPDWKTDLDNELQLLVARVQSEESLDAQIAHGRDFTERIAEDFEKVLSQAIQAARIEAKEEERKSIADSIDSFPLQDSMFFDENNWEAGYKALGEFKQSIINKHQ